jgi:putative Mn2+ efflux pump MntP
MTGAASKAVAGCFALAAFAVAVVAGIAAGNPPTSILIRALMAMLICYPLGMMIGLVCQHVIEQHIKAEARANIAVEPGAGVVPPEQHAEIAEEVGDVTVV